MKRINKKKKDHRSTAFEISYSQFIEMNSINIKTI